MTRVMMTLGSLSLQTGGPAAMIEGLSKAVVDLGHDLTIASQIGNGEREVSLDERVRVERFPAGWPRAYSPSGHLKVYLARESSRAQIIHTFGLWRAINRYSWLAAKDQRRPLVVSPQGMLAPAALCRRRSLKSITWRLWQRKALTAVACIHATSDREAEDVRQAAGVELPVVIVPNGVTIPDRRGCENSKELRIGEGVLRPRSFFLYLGRIHPFKGLEDLFQAWDGSGCSEKGLRLVIAGPCEPRFEGWFKRLLEISRHKASIEYVGETDGDEKEWLLSRARALVLPSRSENFGIVVAEALASATPAIANYGAPWALLVDRDCGWWVPAGPEALRAALEDASNRSRENIEALGERGRSVVREEFDWSSIARKMGDVYQWLSGQGSRPSFVQAE